MLCDTPNFNLTTPSSSTTSQSAVSVLQTAASILADSSNSASSLTTAASSLTSIDFAFRADNTASSDTNLSRRENENSSAYRRDSSHAKSNGSPPNYTLDNHHQQQQQNQQPLYSSNQTLSTQQSTTKKSSRVHPHIQHHPTIHPHRHNRALSSTSDNSSIPSTNGSMVKMRENNNSLNNVLAQTQSSNDSNNSNESDTLKEIKKTESEISETQDLIDKLNDEIFKNPHNHTRPPSEYLEIYNQYTGKLHWLQVRKENLEQAQKIHQEAINKSNNNNNNWSSSTSSLWQDAKTNGHSQFNDTDNDTSAPQQTSPEISFSPSNANDFKNPQHHLTVDNESTHEQHFDHKKPPLPNNISQHKNQNFNSINTINNSTTSNGLPEFKINHPTTLNTNSQAIITTKIKTPQTPTLPINYKTPPNISASTSPATTPTYGATASDHSPPSHQTNYLSPSSSSVSLSNASMASQNFNLINTIFANTPTSANSNNNISGNNNNNNNHLNSQYSVANNSRSFGDINDAIIGPILNGIATTPNNSVSPSASSATTPTYNPSLVRVYIGSSTAVIEKKPIMLKEALSSKLKSRNLDIDKCVAFIKDLNIKIEWDYDLSRLNVDQIVVAEVGDEIRHSFEKKTFSIKSCDACKKRFLLNVYTCSKCNYVMCQRNECRARSERIVCAPRRANSEFAIRPNPTIGKPDIEIIGRPESPLRENIINISQQILPVTLLNINIPSRDRSRSETELNIIVNPKLTIEANRPVPKSPSTSGKSTNKSSIYGTIPRNQIIKPSTSAVLNSTNKDDISGSVNDKSGSVVSSLGKSLNIDKIPKTETITITAKNSKQSKPCRRDSFNSWEIPFSQIKIDMNKKVGSGSFGIVHQGRDFYHGTVAIKFLNVQNPTHAQAQAFRNEVAILKSTRHDNILLFIGCILKPYLAIVTEWCPGSSLYRHLHVQEEHWDMFQLIDLAKQTAIGMEYLHASDILHRDLKSNNIFLIPKESNTMQTYRPFNGNNKNKLNEFLMNDARDTEKWTVKIGDFGLATVKSTWTQSSVKANQPTGSILWMAPEVITQKVPDPYTQKSDVYSYAVVLYELFSGHLPYQHKEQNMILFLVGSGRLKPNPEDSRPDTPKEIKDLIVSCSQYDRNQRYDFVEINDMLKQIRLVKSKSSKLERAQSLPNISSTQDHSQSLGFYDDEMYPGTPHPDMLSKINSPLQFASGFNDMPSNESIAPNNNNNNNADLTNDSSQTTTNL